MAKIPPSELPNSPPKRKKAGRLGGGQPSDATDQSSHFTRPHHPHSAPKRRKTQIIRIMLMVIAIAVTLTILVGITIGGCVGKTTGKVVDILNKVADTNVPPTGDSIDRDEDWLDNELERRSR